MTRPRAAARHAATVVLVLLVVPLVGCGSHSVPGETVPGLRTTLSQVDNALAAQRYGRARTALDALVRQTVEARDSGRLDDQEAGRILAAAAQLAADLPAAPKPTATAAQPTGEEEEKEKDAETKDEDQDD